MDKVAAWLNQIEFPHVSNGGVLTLRIFSIIVAAWILAAILQRAIRLLRKRVASQIDDPEALKRADTLGRVFRYIVVVVISVVAFMLILSEVGISLAPILGAAGVVGVAVGFGAQSLVKDFFNGFFILFEDQIRKGDVIEVGEHSGLVEEITLRYVRLRDYDGQVHFLPNGMITSVVNKSRGYAYAVIDAGIAYRENVDEVFNVMRKVGAEMRADEQWRRRLLEDLEIAGIERWDPSAVVLRCRFKVAPLEQWNVRREFLRRLKHAFDTGGIEIPFPHLTLYTGSAKDASASAPALEVRTIETRSIEPRKDGQR